MARPTEYQPPTSPDGTAGAQLRVVLLRSEALIRQLDDRGLIELQGVLASQVRSGHEVLGSSVLLALLALEITRRASREDYVTSSR